MKIVARIGWFLLFTACGLLVFIVFSHYFPLIKGRPGLFGRVILGLALLSIALAARRSERFRACWLIPFAFFTALTAISVDYYFGLSKWIVPALGLEMESPAGLMIDKLESSLLGILIVLGLNRLAGQSLDSLYIRRGNLWLGLGVGLVAFAVFIASVIFVAETSFKAENLTWARLLPWMPFILVMVLANASDEELIFRGLLIGKMEPHIGKFATNLATTIPFVIAHAFTSYSLDNFIFLALQLIPLSLLWCWLMQKSNSIWGSILFHAAADIPVFVGIFSQL